MGFKRSLVRIQSPRLLKRRQSFGVHKKDGFRSCPRRPSNFVPRSLLSVTRRERGFSLLRKQGGPTQPYHLYCSCIFQALPLKSAVCTNDKFFDSGKILLDTHFRIVESRMHRTGNLDLSPCRRRKIESPLAGGEDARQLQTLGSYSVARCHLFESG